MTTAQTLRGDVFGGFTAAVVALPLALAFGVASGLGAEAGLYGAIAVGFIAAIAGGTPVQVSGPTGPMTVAIALVATQFASTPGTIVAVIALAGLFQIAFGLAGVGRYVKLVPMPVVSGFMSGIGVIIIVLQIAPMLGHVAPAGPILVKLLAIPDFLAAMNVAPLVLGVVTLAVMTVMPGPVARMFPPPLAAIVLGTVLGMTVFPGAATIGALPTGLPSITIPAISLGELPDVVRFALVLAFLGSVDSLLTSLVVDSINRAGKRHDSNRELIGQGLGNIAAGFVGGLPGAGATMRTLVNIKAGGSTRLSGAIHAVLLAGVVLGFGSLASHIPLAVLAGILLKVGYDIIDWRYLKRIRTAPRAGIVIMSATLLLTVFVDLVTAVAAGFVMASVLFVARMADAQIKSTRVVSGPAEHLDLTPEEQAILERWQGRIVLCEIEGPLSFGSARDVSDILHGSKEQDVLILDLNGVPFIDSSASIALEDVLLALRERNDELVLFGVRPGVVRTLEQIGFLARLGSGLLVRSRLEALRLGEAKLSASD